MAIIVIIIFKLFIIIIILSGHGVVESKNVRRSVVYDRDKKKNEIIIT